MQIINKHIYYIESWNWTCFSSDIITCATRLGFGIVNEPKGKTVGMFSQMHAKKMTNWCKDDADDVVDASVEVDGRIQNKVFI